MSQFTNRMISRGALTLLSSGKISSGLLSSLTGPGRRTSHGMLVAKHVRSRPADQFPYIWHAWSFDSTIVGRDCYEVVPAESSVEHERILQVCLAEVQRRSECVVNLCCERHVNLLTRKDEPLHSLLRSVHDNRHCADIKREP